MSAFARTIMLLVRSIVSWRDMGGVRRRQKWLRDEESRRVRRVQRRGKGGGEGTMVVVAKGAVESAVFHGRFGAWPINGAVSPCDGAMRCGTEGQHVAAWHEGRAGWLAAGGSCFSGGFKGNSSLRRGGSWPRDLPHRHELNQPPPPPSACSCL